MFPGLNPNNFWETLNGMWVCHSGVSFPHVGDARESLDAASQALTFNDVQGAGAPETSLASMQRNTRADGGVHGAGG